MRRKLKQQRDLQRQVSEHLKEYRPKNRDALYVHFDLHRTARIGPALVDLLQWEHIELDKDNEVNITATVPRWLENKEY
jgi:hypothetical protein